MKLLKLFVLFFLLGILGVCGWLAYCETRDPLVELERAVRATNYIATSSRVEQDGSDLYWPAIELQGVMFVVLDSRVTYGNDRSSRYFGLTNSETRDVFISDKLSWNARFAVLAHEAGHVLQPNGLTEAEGEVFAEGVAFLVGLHYGHGRLDQHAHYLAGNKSGLYVLSFYAKDIRHAANVLTAR